MKRHLVLQPFSRDHNLGLVIARKLMENRVGASAELLRLWDDEMRDHFEEEERLLIPLASSEQADRLLSDHCQIQFLIDRAQLGHLTDAAVTGLGKLLSKHIRWEERVFFPLVEASSEIETISSETAALELRRHASNHSPRRAELVRARGQKQA